VRVLSPDGRVRTSSRADSLGGLRTRFAVGVAWIVLAGCSRAGSEHFHPPLHLTHIRPSIPEGLFLNEELVFYFDADLDPVSVTSASIAIVSDDGRPARGELRVEGDRIRFVPAAVLSPDLSGGGYEPDTRYTVRLAGFPHPQGVRSARGQVLEKTWRWSFRTVQATRPRTGLVFEDRMQDRVGLLRLFPAVAGQGGLIRTQDSIYLACDKPIDPSTVRSESFLLAFRRDFPPGRSESEGPLGLRVRVLENESEVGRRPKPAGIRSSAPAESWARERRACLLELTPERRLAPGHWDLQLIPESADGEPTLRDFGGKPVLLAEPSVGFRINVNDPSAEAGRGGELSEEFEDRRYFSPVAVPGCDGTAFWSDTGRLEVRFPKAAGGGEDGPVRLGEREDRRDIRATTIELEQDAVCRLQAEAGLVVLRCQGRMSIRGSLVREAPFAGEGGDDPTLLEWEKLCLASQLGSRTLSEWLSDQRDSNRDWTVLVAGGDLSIEGHLSTTTPLLLVAGGRIRVSGSVHGAKRATGEDGKAVGCVYLLGDGGGFKITPPPSLAPIVMDAPQGANPLRVSLRFGALSGPVPQGGDVRRWLAPETSGSPERPQARWRIRYLRELSDLPPEAANLASADSPTLLDPPGPIQFLVELEVGTGGIWDPPWLDYVHLAWEQSSVGTGPGGDDR